MKYNILRTVFCLLIITLPSAARAQEQTQDNQRFLEIQQVSGKSGVKAWLVEDHSLPVISLSFAFKGTGSVSDPVEKQGIARLTSNMLDEGAGEYDSQRFQKTLTDHSITLSFSSSRDYFQGSLKTLSRNKELAFELLYLSLTQPRFDEEPLARMRAANIARIRSSLSDPGWMAARILNDAAFEGHPYALNSGGTLTTLSAITANDLRAFVSDGFSRDRLMIGVTGDITAKELSAALDQIFSDLPATGPIAAVADTPITNGGSLIVFEQDIPQTIIEILQPGLDREDPDFHAAQIMNFILGGSGFGSRLTEQVREKRGLTYGIGSSLMVMDHAKALSISTSTENKNAGEVMGLIRAEMQAMKDTPISDKELADAKSYLIGSLPLNLSSTDRIAGLLLSLQLDRRPIDYLDTLDEKYSAVTADDVQRVAQRLLTPDAMTVIMVGQPENVTPTRTVDTLPHVE